jgi:NMD protein affecting ribosome stability and mRNA decay
MAAQWESRDLLAILLKKIPGLNKVKVVDAGFIWTEPHSKRVQVKLTIQKEVLARIKLQHTFPVEFIIAGQQCEDCARSFTEHTWRAIVQVRQRVAHKKTFFYLEQLILKHGAHEHATNMEQMPDGVDFQFMERSHATKFMDFLQSVIPCTYKTSKQLVSANIHETTYNYKYSFMVTIIPLCRDDLVLLPPITQKVLGLPHRLALIYRVTNYAYVVDPCSVQVADINMERYNKEPLHAIMSAKQLQEYVVYDVVPITITAADAAKNQSQQRRKRVSRRNKGRQLTAISESEDVIFSAHDASSVAGSAAQGGADQSTVASRAASAIASLASGKKFSKNMGLAMARSVASSGLVSGKSSVATTVSGGPRGRYLLADITIGPADNNPDPAAIITIRSHLGHVLKPGDSAVGYDLKHAVYRDQHDEEDTMAMTGGKKGKSKGKGKGNKASKGRHSQRGGDEGLPDVVLVRKKYEKRDKGARKWKLKSLGMTNIDHARPIDLEREKLEREEFLQELEEDKFLRSTINMYRDLSLAEGGAAAGSADAAVGGSVLGSDLKRGAKSGVPAAAPASAAAAASAGRVAFAASTVGGTTGPKGNESPEVGLDELLEEMSLSEKSISSSNELGMPAVHADSRLASLAAAASPALQGGAALGRGTKRSSDGQSHPATGDASDEEL